MALLLENGGFIIRSFRFLIKFDKNYWKKGLQIDNFCSSTFFIIIIFFEIRINFLHDSVISVDHFTDEFYEH